MSEGRIVSVSGLSFPTASKAVQTLAAWANLDIVHELTGRRRNRVFVYSAYFNILNKDGQPL